VDIVVRAAALFFFVWLITRAVGRRELSTFEPFDLILVIVVGDLIQQGVTQNDFSVTGAMLATATIGLLTVFLSWLNFRFPRVQPVFEGDPVIVLQDGKPIERNLRRNRITVEELAAQARMHEISQLEDIQWAVLETSGAISFIKKSS
jgi:uncharacterized membrane protein YcaP (DUF421 family)